MATNVLPGTPTQVAHPWKATFRTFWQSVVPSLILVVGVLPQVIQMFLDQFGETLPPEVYGWFVGASVLIAGVAALFARIMAIPAINELVKKIGLGTGVETETPTPVENLRADPEGPHGNTNYSI